MRSALLAVKGVTRARVTLEEHEALVVFDPTQTSVTALIEAVAKADGVAGPNQYSARVKEPGR